MKRDNQIIEEENKNSSMGTKVVLGAGAVGAASSNAFALAATDFPTATATADMGLAAAAVITLAVTYLGFIAVRKVMGF